MIRWCSYCQAFLGEAEPYGDPRFTHGACTVCYERSEHDDGVIAATAGPRALFGRLLESARAGEVLTCAALIEQGQALGLSGEAIAVGLLQPALYQAGIDWQDARMSVAAEHRFTSWCERVFHLLAAQRKPQTRSLDLLVFQTPGNRHTVGPQFAAHALAARGLATDVLVPELPFDEMLALTRAAQPRIVGFSCAIFDSVPVAVEQSLRLRERLAPALRPRFVLSGMAFRLGQGYAASALPEGIEVVRSLDELAAPAVRAAE